MTKEQKRIAVIGAGVAGITAAYYLAKAGHDVAVYDRERYPGMRCSYANGGQISVSNSETWHSWSNVYKGIKWMFKNDAPLLIRPGLDPDRWLWLLRFLKNTWSGARVENTKRLIELGLESRLLYEQIAADEGIDFLHTKAGILHIYKDPTYFRAAKDVQRLYEDAGCEWKILTSSQVLGLEPSLYNCRGIIGGVWTADDWTGDIHQFCTALADVLRNKYRVSFYYGTGVDSGRLDDLIHLNDAVVIAAGAEAVELANDLRDPCTIYPIKGYSITVTPPNGSPVPPQVSILDDSTKIVCTNLGGKLRIAGTAELCGYNYDVRYDRIKPLLDWMEDNLPQIPADNYSQWACLRPMTADMLPMVGRSSKSGVWYHAGHGHLGWTTAPATAVRLAEEITGVAK